jgi:hypothetical protein|tara:strand:+ start:1733 stop:1945 length:213 start_codon:yes stop_codon:yes gene_type:complete
MDFEDIKKIATFLTNDINHTGVNIELLLDEESHKTLHREIWELNRWGDLNYTEEFEMTIGEIKFRFLIKK